MLLKPQVPGTAVQHAVAVGLQQYPIEGRRSESLGQYFRWRLLLAGRSQICRNHLLGTVSLQSRLFAFSPLFAHFRTLDTFLYAHHTDSRFSPSDDYLFACCLLESIGSIRWRNRPCRSRGDRQIDRRHLDLAGLYDCASVNVNASLFFRVVHS